MPQLVSYQATLYRQKSMLQPSESNQPSIIKNVPGIHEPRL